MPPKKAKRKSEATKQEDDPVQPEQVAAEETEHAPLVEPAPAAEDEPQNEKRTKPPPSSKKRKDNASDDAPHKAARRTGRSAPKPQPSQQQLLRFLLSDEAAALSRPDDETTALESTKTLRTYSSSVLNPFEELLCAVILSRPISHRLGLRTIRTILNAPYTFTSAKAIQDAGSERQHQALWDARTQHKDKTATQIGQLADVVMEKFTGAGDEMGTEMQKVRDECDRQVDKERALLRSSIKGLGPTGLDIFFRRVQWVWTAGYPFVDERTGQSLRNLGLPDDGEELRDLIKEHWKELTTEELAGDDDEAKKRRAFVVLLERATGADLEARVDQVLEAAAA